MLSGNVITSVIDVAVYNNIVRYVRNKIIYITDGKVSYTKENIKPIIFNSVDTKPIPNPNTGRLRNLYGQ